MANFSLVIVHAKVLTGGKHKVRVMVSHNGQTRYIPTDIIIDSISEFKEGRVVKRPDKDILNLRLKKICDKSLSIQTNNHIKIFSIREIILNISPSI